MEKIIKIIDESGDKKMLWDTIGKPAYEKGLLEGRQEAGLFAIIPMSILENKTLSANAKLLYGEIMALSKKSGLCYATNEYMADMLGLAKRSIPQILKELSGCGLIIIDIKRSKKGTYRDITVSFFNNGEHRCRTRGGFVKERGGASLGNEDKREIDKIEIDKIDNKICKIENFADKQPNEINLLIEKFKPINPTYQRLFSKPVQRSSLERLIKQFGYEQVEKMINGLSAIFGKQYAPQITTPYELENKLANYVSFLKRENSQEKKGISL